MKYRASLLLALSVLLAACSATGPVKFYSGPAQPKDKLAIVTVPAPITVLSIDGKEVDSPSKESGTYQLQMEPGRHLIEFRYELYWGSPVSGMLIKSKDTGVDADFQAGHTYELRYKVPQDADEASNILTHFPAQLVDLKNDKHYDSYVIENLDAAMAAIKEKANKAPAQASVSGTGNTAPMPNAETASKADPVKRLKFWWLMANKQQRKQFTDWMKGANESFAPSSDKTPSTAPPGTINGVKIKP